MEIEIDKNIPIPERAGREMYPFPKMAIGDSFFVKGKTANALRSASINYRREGQDYISRQLKEGARIWRIK